MKAAYAKFAQDLTDIPNIGPRMADDFRRLGIKNPVDLKGKDALSLYKRMCALTGVRQDPCVLDTYMAAIDFMGGAPAKPWWNYTAERKKKYPNI